ncbi:MAG: hypothetical protein JOZ17_10775 [Acetobacteraceae bacterium]|nr:hypothetical protein [Acetobacteraceae bacterium]
MPAEPALISFAIGTAILRPAILLVLNGLLAARRGDAVHLVRSAVAQLVFAANRGGFRARLLLGRLVL